MFEAFWLVLFLLALTITAILAYPYVVRIAQRQKTRHQGVVKHDWLPTGRIDFATRSNEVGDRNKERPAEFKLLVEERRIVESTAGNENLEIQWRLATLSEAKTVVSQYHKYLSENSLIKSIPDLSAASPPAKTARSIPSAQLHSVKSSTPLATA